ncbi:response regulator transcription factor [Pedobacter alpinus]|uniref:Response regulator transcription factor n=1 Tax=Pedobacter alpinus TaxID=1590643 RepID=A0ABW5TSC4_9SPHI
METIYANNYINISYHKNLNMLNGAWNNCNNVDDYLCGINNFKAAFLNIKPKHTLWNNLNLDASLCENLQKRAKSFLSNEYLSKSLTGKIAMVLPERLYARFKVKNFYEELDQDMKLRFFEQEKSATDWLATSSWLKEAGAVPQLNIKEASDDKYELSLTINKCDYQKYTTMLNHLLRGQEFCLKNLDNFNSLTCREQEILQYIIKGFKNNDIADSLFLSVETIKTHRKNILTKLNCQNVFHLTQYLMFFKC